MLIDLYGEQYTFYTDALHVYFLTSLRTSPILAFDQAVADSPIAPTIDPTGKIVVTYLDGGGNRLSKSSQSDGDAGSWS